MKTGLHSTRELRAAGFRTRDIRGAVVSGALQRPRRGWYATPGTPPDLVTACRVGGRLTCLGALRLHGCWVPGVFGVHVRVADGIEVTRIAGSRLHWSTARVGPGLDSPEEALSTAADCLSLRELVIVADSLSNRSILSMPSIARALTRTPRGRRALELVDPRAESGIETMLRLALRRLRVRVRSQVVVPGVGRVDFLIGERLVIEADGYEWHADRDAFERDRARDREFVGRGYLVLRVTYRQAHDDLDAVTVAVLGIVRRRDHRWRAIHRSQLSSWGHFVDLSSTNPGRDES